MTKSSNRITWPQHVIDEAAKKGFRPFLGYWVRIGDGKLYTLEEIGVTE